MSTTLTDTIIQISCLLSILGSLAVASTWAYPLSNRKKPGRILLLWLSITDFFSSFFYFLQTFNLIRESPSLCQACALLDIFFPVASFLWTDFIAFYIFLIVTTSSSSSSSSSTTSSSCCYYYSTGRLSWSVLLKCFHGLVWTISFLILCLVLFFHHAGHEGSGSSTEEGDDSFDSNTGGWCWIAQDDNSPKTTIFLWEVIGGKAIEWLSACAITYLYLAVGCSLWRVDGKKTFWTTTTTPPPPPATTTTMGGGGGGGDGCSSTYSSSYGYYYGNQEEEEEDHLIIIEGGGGVGGGGGESSVGQVEEESLLSIGSSSRPTTLQSGEGRVYYPPTHHNNNSLSPRNNNNTNHNNNNNSNYYYMKKSGSGSIKKTLLFNRFFIKLAFLPLVFIFVRFWSTLRILLNFTTTSTTTSNTTSSSSSHSSVSNNTFLMIMQAAFDPAQGFFNACFFVLFSKSDRSRLARFTGYLFSTLLHFVTCGYYGRSVPKEYYLLSTPNSASDFLPRPLLPPPPPPPADGGSGSGGSGSVEKRRKEEEEVVVGSDSQVFHDVSDGEEEQEEEEIVVEDDFECDESSRLSDFSFDFNHSFS